jgi:hypothetical protein
VTRRPESFTQLELFATGRLCQRWRAGRQSWQQAGARFDPNGYDVRPIPDDTTASAYVRANHYSASYVAALHRFGLFQAGRLVGVAVYSNPVTPQVLTCVLPDLRPAAESVELGRFVLDDAVPGNGESWMLARCHELLVAAGVAAVVSFADPIPRRTRAGTVISPGHVGIIYQATNATYTGRSWPRTIWMLPDGTTFNGKAQSKIRQQQCGHEYAERTLVRWGARPMRSGEDPKAWLREAKQTARVTTHQHPGNHRYVFALGNARQRRDVRIAVPAMPYPKRIETGELVAAR